MNWLTYLSWLAGPALQVLLLTFMVRRKFHLVFPRFFSYIIFQIVKSGVLFVTYRFYEVNYFDAYWTGNAISVLLAVAVMDEVLQKLFKQYGGIQTLGTTIFRWACGLLLLLAIVGAIFSNTGSADRVAAAVMTFDRSVRLMQCGVFLLLMLVSRLLKHSWRQPTFGIALGFGIFASIELILVTVAMSYSDTPEAAISLVKSIAFNAVTLLWIGYLKQQPESVPQIEVAPRVNALNMALAGSTMSDGDPSFMTMVEQAVDRVLSRHTWPATPADESDAANRISDSEDVH